MPQFAHIKKSKNDNLIFNNPFGSPLHSIKKKKLIEKIEKLIARSPKFHEDISIFSKFLQIIQYNNTANNLNRADIFDKFIFIVNNNNRIKIFKLITSSNGNIHVVLNLKEKYNKFNSMLYLIFGIGVRSAYDKEFVSNIFDETHSNEIKDCFIRIRQTYDIMNNLINQYDEYEIINTINDNIFVNTNRSNFQYTNNNPYVILHSFLFFKYCISLGVYFPANADSILLKFQPFIKSIEQYQFELMPYEIFVNDFQYLIKKNRLLDLYSYLKNNVSNYNNSIQLKSITFNQINYIELQLCNEKLQFEADILDSLDVFSIPKCSRYASNDIGYINNFYLLPTIIELIVVFIEKENNDLRGNQMNSDESSSISFFTLITGGLLISIATYTGYRIYKLKKAQNSIRQQPYAKK